MRERQNITGSWNETEARNFQEDAKRLLKALGAPNDFLATETQEARLKSANGGIYTHMMEGQETRHETKKGWNPTVAPGVTSIEKTPRNKLINYISTIVHNRNVQSSIARISHTRILHPSGRRWELKHYKVMAPSSTQATNRGTEGLLLEDGT